MVREALELLFLEECEIGFKLNLLNKHGAAKQSKISAAAVFKSHVTQNFTHKTVKRRNK